MKVRDVAVSGHDALVLGFFPESLAQHEEFVLRKLLRDFAEKPAPLDGFDASDEEDMVLFGVALRIESVVDVDGVGHIGNRSVSRKPVQLYRLVVEKISLRNECNQSFAVKFVHAVVEARTPVGIFGKQFYGLYFQPFAPRARILYPMDDRFAATFVFENIVCQFDCKIDVVFFLFQPLPGKKASGRDNYLAVVDFFCQRIGGELPPVFVRE